MSTSENYVPSRLSESENKIKADQERVEVKVQEVGCCGDVPKVTKVNNKKRDKLLEWLKSSQLKREENNRQVFSRWIDMVDNGAIDLMSLSNYPGKPSKPLLNQSPTTSNIVSSTNNDISSSKINSVSNISPSNPKTISPNTIKSPAIPTVCPQYFSPISSSNYYGVTPNWFTTANQHAAIYSSMPMAQQQSMGVYQGSYCGSSNYYQYMPVQQACTMCPSYVLPNISGNIELGCNVSVNQSRKVTLGENSDTINMDTTKWFEVLNDIKLSGSKTHMGKEGPGIIEGRDYKDES